MSALFLSLFLGCSDPPPPPALPPAPVTPARKSKPSVPWRVGSQAPSLFVDGSDLLLIWMEDQPSPRVRWARYRGGSWSEAGTIDDGPGLLVNWADTPQIARGGDGAMYVSWPRIKVEDGTAYDVILGRSADDGETWTELGSPHRDGTTTEHGMVSLIPTRTGVEVIWLDGRATTKDGPMALRGAAISAEIGKSSVLDDSVCECCGTDAAQTLEGPIVAYRDRSAEEVRDIGVVRREGGKWAVPSLVSRERWKIAGCPVNGPRVHAQGRNVDVIWFTAQPEPAVQFASSPDGGRSFGAPLRFAAANTLGRVDLVAEGKNALILTWMDEVDGDGIIRASRFSRLGSATKPYDIASVSSSRGSGFPRVAIVEEDLFVIWTDAGPPRILEYERVPLDEIGGN